MTYHSGHLTNLIPLNLKFRQKLIIFIVNGWSENGPWSPAEIWTMKQAMAQAGYQHLALMMEGWQKLLIFSSVVVCIRQKIFKEKCTNHTGIVFFFKIFRKRWLIHRDLSSLSHPNILLQPHWYWMVPKTYSQLQKLELSWELPYPVSRSKLFGNYLNTVLTTSWSSGQCMWGTTCSSTQKSRTSYS